MTIRQARCAAFGMSLLIAALVGIAVANAQPAHASCDNLPPLSAAQVLSDVYETTTSRDRVRIPTQARSQQTPGYEHDGTRWHVLPIADGKQCYLAALTAARVLCEAPLFCDADGFRNSGRAIEPKIGGAFYVYNGDWRLLAKNAAIADWGGHNLTPLASTVQFVQLEPGKFLVTSEWRDSSVLCGENGQCGISFSTWVGGIVFSKDEIRETLKPLAATALYTPAYLRDKVRYEANAKKLATINGAPIYILADQVSKSTTYPNIEVYGQVIAEESNDELMTKYYLCEYGTTDYVCKPRLLAALKPKPRVSSALRSATTQGRPAASSSKSAPPQSTASCSLPPKQGETLSAREVLNRVSELNKVLKSALSVSETSMAYETEWKKIAIASSKLTSSTYTLREECRPGNRGIVVNERFVGIQIEEAHSDTKIIVEIPTTTAWGKIYDETLVSASGRLRIRGCFVRYSDIRAKVGNKALGWKLSPEEGTAAIPTTFAEYEALRERNPLISNVYCFSEVSGAVLLRRN